MILFLLIITLPVNAQENPPQYGEIATIHRQNIPPIYMFAEYFAFSPDGTRIAAADPDSVNVWEIETGAVIHTLDHASTAVSWSPDGTKIATGVFNETLRVWDVTDGSLLYETEQGSNFASGWSPDSTRLVTSSMIIYDAASGEEIGQLGSNWNLVYETLWSPDGTMIATPGGYDGGDFLHIWSPEGERLDTYWGGISAAWSPDSTRLASRAQVRDVATGLPVTIIPQMNGIIDWHPNGAWIASAGNDMMTNVGDSDTVFLWNAETGAQVAQWQFDDCLLLGFAWSTDGERFAVSCRRSDYSSDLIIMERTA